MAPKKRKGSGGGRPAQEYSQALRLLKIVDMLQHRAQITIAELMDEFDINRRTVQRDLNVLGEIYAIEEGERTSHNEKTFRLMAGHKTQTIKLTIMEMVTLFMGRNLFAFTKGTDLAAAMTSLYDKLQTRLSSKNAKVRERLPKKIYCTSGFPKSYKAKDDVLNHVLTGLLQEKKVAIRYRIPGKPAYDDVIHPYTLVVHNNALYVICHSERAGARRTFALERIRKSDWRNQGTFDYPDRYDPQKELNPAFGISTSKRATPIKLVFNEAFAPYVGSRTWHPSMKAKQRRDGSLEIEMKVSVGEELLHWITGYGGGVRVVSPKSLREVVRARHVGGRKSNM